MVEEVKPEIGVDELRDQLDALWEKHLTLLDSYHQAQQQLARHFSSGFFDLAQATFKSTSRVRYGQEYYDDRMQATRRFEASTNDNDLPCLALKADDTSPSTDTSNEHSTKSGEKSSDKEAKGKKPDQPDQPEQQQPTPPSTPPRDTEEEKLSEEQDKSKTTSDQDKAQKKPRDPLHWYGILVPPALRASQKSFISAVESPLIEAANSAQALRLVAVEIRKLRKDIKKAERRLV
ncbi:hypothetical protein D6D10_09181 [Aureobasidium pullulans]|uniref:Vacuolar ATPase assembly protein VMA22 n=1 Tax=Aureobasidium pullulans TaxID=5580 RepID=A0A4S9E3R5_AURPU|nr:hypothetical protein D6D10_09181 [Aureobasidium pullulans]